MGILMISSSQMCISREQEEFLAAYRTDEARQSFIDSYGKEKVNFLDGGYGENSNKPWVPEPPFPYDFEVEYLEMNDNKNPSYLDLGFTIPHVMYDVFVVFMPLGFSGGWAPWFGNYFNDVTYTVGVATKTLLDGTYIYYDHSGSLNNVSFPTTLGVKYDISILTNGIGYVNGLEYQLRSSSTELLENDFPFRVFITNYSTFTYGRVYKIIIRENSTDVHNFIPVVKDGVGYMYDKVTGNFFGAQGGGSFVVGPRI